VSWRTSLGPLRERSFRWYFASRCSDTLGTMMAGIALAFAVLEITDSATALGQVLAAHTIPMVVLMLFGGVVADRFPRQLVLQLSNTAAAATQGLLAVLVITGRAELWMVMVLAGLNGAVDAINFPAQASMVPQLVTQPQLQSANALISMSRGVLAIVAPTVSALLVVGVGPGWALAVNAGTWLLAALLLLPVHLPARPPQQTPTNMVQELAEGWSLFRGTTWLWVVVLGFGFLNAIHVGAWFTLGPGVAKDTIGEQGWGLVLSAESAGLLLMTVLLLRVRLRRPLLVGMLGCSLMGFPLAALGLAPDLVLLVPLAFVAGAGVQVFGIGWNLAMQENVEERMLSRAYSYDALGSYVAMPVGQLVYGPLGEAFGTSAVLVWSGVAYVLISLLVLASRSVRTLDRPPERLVGRPTSDG
jgi:MFS family permease